MVPFVAVFSEAIIFALYIFICLTLMKPRFSLKTRILAYGVVLLCSGGAVTALSLSGNAMEALTLLPLIAYLPFSLCVYILSEGGIFETAAACSLGTLASLILKTIKKIELTLSNTAEDIVVSLTIFALALGAAIVVFRFIRKPFAVCARSNMKNRLLVLIPAVTVFLLLYVSLDNPAQIAVLIMTLIIAVSVFAIAACLLVYSAKAADADETEKSLSKAWHCSVKISSRSREASTRDGFTATICGII